MIKKQERIKYLVSLRNAIINPDYTEVTPNRSQLYVYDGDVIKMILYHLEYLLKNEGVEPITRRNFKAK